MDGGSKATGSKGSIRAQNCLGSISWAPNGLELLDKATLNSTIQGNYSDGDHINLSAHQATKKIGSECLPVQ